MGSESSFFSYDKTGKKEEVKEKSYWEKEEIGGRLEK